jgi:cysteinyl-tRNA synthetase
MTLRLKGYKENFVPIDSDSGIVRVYACGPTPYDEAHLGHARSSLAADVVCSRFIAISNKARQANVKQTRVNFSRLGRENTQVEKSRKFMWNQKFLVQQVTVDAS